jgi:sugar phosphate isomerase/epimerase
MFKQCISWWCFEGKIAPEALLKAALDIGFAGVELNTGRLSAITT